MDITKLRVKEYDMGLDDVQSIIAKINTNGDNIISKQELSKAEGQVPSVWLEKIKELAGGKNIELNNVITGLGVESNPDNKPITSYNDRRAELGLQEDYADNIEHVPTKAEYTASYDKEKYDVSLSMTTPLNPDLDFSDAGWYLQECSFGENTFANTPKEHLPEGYDPKIVFENGKNPGLNVRTAHEMGYTGKGVKVAILDWQLPPSDNYDSNIVSYKAQDNAKNIPETMHGAAVTSVLAGKETGVAPDAEVYYFAEKQANGKGEPNDDMIKSFQNILEINKNLPDDQKIRVISISGPIYGGEEAEKLVEELNDSGVWVMSGDEFWNNFGYLDKKDPMGNPDDFDNYNIHTPADSKGKHLYVNSGNRTVSHFTAASSYRHDSKACASWAMPVVSGYYALACQADPSMTPERFMELAEETAQVKDLKVFRDYDDIPQNNYERHEGYTEYMIETIQKDRPEYTRKQCMKLDKDTWDKYNEKMIQNLTAEYGEDQDLEKVFIEKGKKVLAARGEYDENGKIKEIPEKYLPKDGTEQAKIIDIEALLKRIEAEKVNS